MLIQGGHVNQFTYQIIVMKIDENHKIRWTKPPLKVKLRATLSNQQIYIHIYQTFSFTQLSIMLYNHSD
mgnify:CR=1 FL=1